MIIETNRYLMMPANIGANNVVAPAENVVRFDLMNYNNVEFNLLEIPLTDDYLTTEISFTIYAVKDGEAMSNHDVVYFTASDGRVSGTNSRDIDSNDSGGRTYQIDRFTDFTVENGNVCFKLQPMFKLAAVPYTVTAPDEFYIDYTVHTMPIAEVIANNLPIGTNEGDILTWDATNLVWVVNANNTSLPDGTNEGDILTWDATNLVWVVNANNATLPTGTNEGDILTWDATNLVWVVNANNTSLPDGTNEGDILTWDATNLVWVVNANNDGLPAGTEAQTLRYNASNQLEATDNLNIHDNAAYKKLQSYLDYAGNVSSIESTAESNSAQISFAVNTGTGAEIDLRSFTDGESEIRIRIVGQDATGKYLMIENSSGKLGFANIPIPNGTNEGDILTWDATNMVWVVNANNASLPTGTNEGDIITWDATNLVWVVNANNASLPDGVNDGDVLVWNDTAQQWQVSHISGLPDGTADNDVLFWDETTQQWYTSQLPVATGGAETVSNIKVANVIDYNINVPVPSVFVPDNHFNISLKANSTYFIEYNIWFDDESVAPRNRTITFGSPVAENVASIVNSKYGTVEMPNIANPDEVYMPLGNVIPSDLTNISYNNLATNFIRIRGHFKPTADMILQVWWTSDTVEDQWTINKNSFVVWQEKYIPYESHNHNLADLTEKSYISLTEKPDLASLHSHLNITDLDNYDPADYAAALHNHNLADLTEKSYISLTEKPDLASLHSHLNITDLDNYDPADFAAALHNHNLADLTEKSYISLTEKPDLASLHSHLNITDLDNYDPADFAAALHNHSISDVTGLAAALAAKMDGIVYATQSNLTFNLASVNLFFATISGNASFSFSNMPTNKWITIIVLNTAGGVVTLPNTADVKKAGTYTHTANGYIEYSVFYNGTVRFWQVSEETKL